ncbi:MAG: flagellar hook-associated protein FlgK [Spirochaetales bacterium]|nr:flagellar hook-associated protein FlgK [Spirochaetales bacterium]
MLSSFTGIEIGKRSLVTHNQSINTVGHNISNASVEGYSRQRVEMTAFPPLYFPGLNREETPGQIGQGVTVERIKRIKDMILEERIVSETNEQGYWSSRDKYILMLEQIYNEPTDLSVRSLLDNYWQAWQELSLHPSEMAARKVVLKRGETLVDGIHDRYTRLKGVRDMLEEDIKATVTEVNEMLREIAALNEQIIKVKAMDDDPNDLMDRRDLIVNRLSSLADISMSTQDPDEHTVVYVGGMHVVQGRHFEPLETVSDPNNEGYSNIVWKGTDQQVFLRGGKLAALLEMRDSDARNEIQKLDMMAVNFMDMVNEIHRKGFGMNNATNNDFFVEYPYINNVLGNYDRNGDGAYDSTYVFRIDGTNKLVPKDQIGLRGTLTLSGPLENVTIEYYPTDTVEDLIERINLSGSEVVARLNQDGQLSLKGTPAANTANPEFVIRHVEDSGQFLVGYAGILPQPGAAGAYDWAQADAVNILRADATYAVAPLTHPSGWITINQEIRNDPGSIVNTFDPVQGGAGDGSAALAIARLRTEPVMIGQITTFDDYFASVVTEIGLKGEQAESAVETSNLVLKELNNLKESISGVNMDEELANMIKFQHGYNAAARFVSEVDKMLDVIINRMGV